MSWFLVLGWQNRTLETTASLYTVAISIGGAYARLSILSLLVCFPSPWQQTGKCKAESTGMHRALPAAMSQPKCLHFLNVYRHMERKGPAPVWESTSLWLFDSVSVLATLRHPTGSTAQSSAVKSLLHIDLASVSHPILLCRTPTLFLLDSTS